MGDCMPRESAGGKGKRWVKRLALLAILALGWGLPCLVQGQTPAEQQPGPQYWLYCPRCGLEMTCPPDLVKEGCICPRCARRDVRMQVTTSPPSQAGESSSNGSPVVRWIALGLAATMAVAWAILKRHQAAQAQAANDLRPASCQVCGATLKYRECDEGLTGTCPTCGETVQYISAESEEPVPDSKDLKEWHEAMKRARRARRSGGKR